MKKFNQDLYRSHVDTYKEHNDKARIALDRMIASETLSDDWRMNWEEYKAESRIANKHWGIAQMMFTKAHS